MTTFISYSRVNSDFAVRLAHDLKSAKFDIWLDQLDIPTGARWDDEIEKALDNSKIFLIILTPESIQSQNVKDEIGYAIDAGKHILPVIIKPCNVPLRIRRFQYVDFTNKPYADSLAEIKHLLADTENVRVEHVVQPEPKKTIDARISIPQEKLAETKSRGQSFMPVIIGGVALVCIAMGVLLLWGLYRGITSSPATTTSNFPDVTNVSQENMNNLASPTEAPTASISIPSTSQADQTEIVDSKGVSMRLVPAASFSMGYGDGDAKTGETVVHTVNVSAFYMDKYLVTNAGYKQCVDEGACQSPMDPGSATQQSYYGTSIFGDYPVINVNWDMASTYCTWRGMRLPTEAQWEKAARGIDGRLYPWGNANPDSSRANFDGTDTTKVGSFENGKSPYGIYDMAGNVWEWVADWYQSDYYAVLGENPSNPLGPVTGTERILRGGSWMNSSKSLRTTLRNFSDPSRIYDYVGFRCAGSVP